MRHGIYFSIIYSTYKMDTNVFRNALGHEDTVNFWDKTLEASKAVIAGGAVLGPYTGFQVNDLDVYVGKENLRTLLQYLTSGDRYERNVSAKKHHLSRDGLYGSIDVYALDQT